MPLYLLTSLLFVVLAILGALDAASASFNLLPWFHGLRWLRVHLITLGVVTEAAFGLLPVLVARREEQPAPPLRLDIWMVLNAGFLTLLVGIPTINQSVIAGGGILVFAATGLLMHHLWQLRRDPKETGTSERAPSRKFYLAGLGYFLLGILVGTGLWLGWNQAVGMRVPIEVHIHANSWGFLSLVFAGLLIDLFPRIAGRPLSDPATLNRIFWPMALGALGLVLGPWFGLRVLTAPGLILHLVGTITLLIKLSAPLRQAPKASPVGMWHLVTSYLWILAPVAVAPLVLFEVEGFSAAGVEQNAPQALIYGWVLQFSYALLPYLFARTWLGEAEASLGGSWFSLVTVHLGGAFLWASIFIIPYQAVLHGTAYALWLASMVPILAQLWSIGQRGAWRLGAAGGEG